MFKKTSTIENGYKTHTYGFAPIYNEEPNRIFFLMISETKLFSTEDNKNKAIWFTRTSERVALGFWNISIGMQKL